MVTRAIGGAVTGVTRLAGRGRGNQAVRVIGAEAVERRIDRIARQQGQFAQVLQQGIAALTRELLRTTPVVTGRLYRSFRINVTSSTIVLSFNTRYAFRVNETSRRNARYVQRGVRRGIAAANRISRATGDGQVVRFRYMMQRGGVQRKGRGGIQISVTYRPVGLVTRYKGHR